MSNIYSAKFMNEASATLKDKVFIKPVNETYLFSAIDALREMNTIINKETEKLYMSIAEADSKEEENKLFADYFYQFKSIFQEFSSKVHQMKSRMIIAVENKVETWEELLKNDEYISRFDKEFNYSGHNFLHMGESDYPRLSLHKYYQKEFDYLGNLMQDNTINASPSTKLKIIATVYNNFSKCSGDKDWIKDLVKDMVDIDDKEITRSYSECIYNSLRDKYEITVNKGMLYTCKENLSDYEDIIDAATKLCDNLLYDVEKVAENISSYLFRNKDNKLKIKTDTDGIIDRDYRLDTYSMNQLDLFIKNKINQINKLLNVYTIAIGIKFDTVVDYIDQNIDILKTAKEYYFNGDDEESENNEDQELDDPVDNESEDNDDDQDDNGDVNDDLDNLDDSEKEPIEEKPEDNDDSSNELEEENEDNDGLESDEENENSDDLELNMEDDKFEEGYLFESELFELEMMYETHNMHQSIKSALLLEEETPDNNQSSSGVDNVSKIADKANVWQKIITKLISLWRKFKEVITTQSKLKVEYLKKNEKYINTSIKGVEGTVTLAYTPDLNALQNLKIEDLNYDAMEQYLVSNDAYCEQYYGNYYNNKGEKSFSDYMKEKILKGERKIDPKDSKYIKEAFDFCEDYLDKVSAIEKQTNIIEKAQRVAKNVSKLEESAVNNFGMYFREMEDNTTTQGDDNKPGEEGENKPSNSGKDAKLAVYFKVSSEILAAKMTMYQKLFNEYFKFCQWYIVKAGGPSMGKSGDKKAQPSNDNQNDVQKFD